MRYIQLCAAFALAVLLASCAGGAGAPPTGVRGAAAGYGSFAPRQKVDVRISIKIPKGKRRHSLHGDYISPSTHSMKIALSGPSAVTETVGLTPASPGCTTTSGSTLCTKSVALEACPTTANCYSGSITTYDAGGHALSANQSVGFSVARGHRNALSLTLDADPASVGVAPLPPSTLTGSQGAGFVLSKCATTEQNLSVGGLDADGNAIAGAGAPIPSLTTDDATHLAVATPAPGAPNTFGLIPISTLTPSAIPNAGTVVHLGAQVTPLTGSGGSMQTAHVDVSFNGDLCGVITEHKIASSAPINYEITTGPDGALWFTERSFNTIGRITTDGTYTAYKSDFLTTTFVGVHGIVAGPDGNLWFTEDCKGNIGRITTNGTLHQFSTSTIYTSGITSGPDGALWFTEPGVEHIGRITTDGLTLHEYGGLVSNAEPLDIAAGPDGNLWFTENCSNKIGRMSTSGIVLGETPIPTSSSAPRGITAGPDGAMWFTEQTGNKIGRITTDGTITEYSTGLTPSSQPWEITAGRDGALWFSEFAGRIGRITTGGAITEYTNGLSGASIWGVTSGPDGALWFAEYAYDVGRLQ